MFLFIFCLGGENRPVWGGGKPAIQKHLPGWFWIAAADSGFSGYFIIYSIPLFAVSLSLSGYLIGYLSHRKTELAPPSCSRSTFEESITEDSVKMEADPLMDWKDVKSLLDQKMTASSIESAFR